MDITSKSSYKECLKEIQKTNCHKISYSYSLNIDVYDKESKMFPEKIGQQRRDVIKIQQLIHLNSNAMKTISGSTYQKKLSSLEEIIVSCH